MPKIVASLKDLLTTGQLGPIGIGTPRKVVADLLGPPDLSSEDRQELPPAVWKYGDIELHFDDTTDQVELIFMERFRIPTGGSKMRLDPWIIQHTLTPDTFQHALEQEQISVRLCQEPYDDPGTLHLRVGVGVHFLFTTERIDYGPPIGLTVISYHRFKRSDGS